jgi:tetratricopeptide (TPR) repeat protein
MNADLESMLIADMAGGKQVELERALLIVSGADTEEQIAGYKQKLDSIEENFREYTSRLVAPWSIGKSAPLTAKELHRFLWITKPNRYNHDFQLTDVIDSQLDENPSKSVGNCVGLTSLYTVLGQRLGLDLSVLSFPKHVLSILNDKGRKYPIENTRSKGFFSSIENYISFREFNGGCISPARELPSEFLVAVLLNSRGITKKNRRDYAGAISDYDKAIELNPDYTRSYCNRGFAYGFLDKYTESLSDLDKAIKLDPGYVEAYTLRGITKDDMGDHAGAIADFSKSIELQPDYIVAYHHRGYVRHQTGDYTGAMADFNTAIEIDPTYVVEYQGRGELYCTLKNYKAAIADFKMMLEIDPANKDAGGLIHDAELKLNGGKKK